MHSSAPRARRRPPLTAARTFTRTRIPSRVLRARLTRTPRSARRANRESRSTDERPLTRHLATARCRRRVASSKASSPGAACADARDVGKKSSRAHAVAAYVRTSVVVVDVVEQGTSRVAVRRRGATATTRYIERGMAIPYIMLEFYLYIDVDGGHDGCHGFVLYKTMWAIL